MLIKKALIEAALWAKAEIEQKTAYLFPISYTGRLSLMLASSISIGYKTRWLKL